MEDEEGRVTPGRAGGSRTGSQGPWQVGRGSGGCTSARYHWREGCDGHCWARELNASQIEYAERIRRVGFREEDGYFMVRQIESVLGDRRRMDLKYV